jgi:hypothetical protein
MRREEEASSIQSTHKSKAAHLKSTNTMPTKKPDAAAAEKGGKKNAPKNEAKGGKKEDKKGKEA